jgi:hypothetical protein
MEELAIAQHEGDNRAGFPGCPAASLGSRVPQRTNGFHHAPPELAVDILPVVQNPRRRSQGHARFRGYVHNGRACFV